MENKELELISRYFDADSFVPLAEKKEYHVYRAFIRSTSDLHIPVPCEAVFKFLSKEQAGIYSQLIDIHSPYVEDILGVYGDGSLFFSVSGNIRRPSQIDYGMADSFPGFNGSSLTLSQFVNHYRIFDPQITECRQNNRVGGKASPTRLRNAYIWQLKLPDVLSRRMQARASSACALRPYRSKKKGTDESFLPEDLALKIAYMLCEGLAELKKKKLTHGDLSPQNILLADLPEMNGGKKLPFQYLYPFIPRIIDFGATKLKKPDDHSMTSIIGTHNFVAPEILAYNKPNDRMDIYSIGCLIHYMCLGSAPGEHGLKSSKKLLSRGVYRIIEKCNADYDNRYKSLDFLKRDILRELRIATSGFERFLYQVPGFRSRRKWKMAIALYIYIDLLMAAIISIADKRLHKLLFVFLFIVAEIIIIFDAFHLEKLSKKYTEATARHPSIRYLVRGFVAILLFVLYLFLYIQLKLA